MVLPAPVGPTMAIVCPGFTSRFMSSMSGASALVAEAHVLEAHLARAVRQSTAAPAASGSSSVSSSSSKTRSAEAMVLWRTLAMLAVCAMGMVNCCEYWMKAWMSPMAMALRVTMIAPATATTT